MIRLKLIYEQILKEVGDLENIKQYSYSSNSFTTDQGWKVNVDFRELDKEELFLLKLKSEYYPGPIFNISFTVEGDETQFSKTNMHEYLKIIKTITEICKDFILKENPNGLVFFAANKDKEEIFSKTDPQKSKFYKAIVVKQLSKIQGWRLINISLYDEFEGFMMYKK